MASESRTRTKKLNVVEMRYLRKLAGKTKWDQIRNKGTINMVQQEEISTQIEKKQLGYMLRINPKRTLKIVMGTKER